MKSVSASTKLSGSSVCGKWPDDSKTTSRLPGSASCAAWACADRDDPVSLPPDDQGGEHRREVQPVVGAHALPTGLDHCAEGADERRAVRGVGQRCVGPPLLLDVGPPHPEPPEATTDGVACVADERREQHRHQVLGAGQRERTEHPRHLPAQAAAGHQDEALAVAGILVGELHRDATTERLADDGRPVDPQGDHQVPERVGVRTEGVVLEWLVGLAVAGEVGSDHGETLCQLREHVPPRGRASGHAVHEEQHRSIGLEVTAHSVHDAVSVQPDLPLHHRRHRAAGSAPSGRHEVTDARLPCTAPFGKASVCTFT